MYKQANTKARDGEKEKKRKNGKREREGKDRSERKKEEIEGGKLERRES